MALGFDNFTGQDFGNSSSQTMAHTVTGTNLILFVFVGHNGSNLDLVTGITYNGVAMTRAVTQNASGMRVYCYYLINPATGTNNVVVSMSSSSFTKVAAASYTGAKQSGQPDSSNGNFDNANTTLTTSTTVITANSWVVGFMGNSNNSAETASTGVNASRGQVNNSYYVGDSNAGESAGLYGMTWTSASQVLCCVLVSITPLPSTNFPRSLSDSIINGASRSVTVGRVNGALRSLSDSILAAASRTVAVTRVLSLARALSDAIMNAASRLTTIIFIHGYVRTLTDSVMNAASRLAVVSRLGMFFRSLNDSVMVGAGRKITVYIARVFGFVRMRSGDQNFPVALDQTGPQKMINNDQNYVKPMDDDSVL